MLGGVVTGTAATKAGNLGKVALVIDSASNATNVGRGIDNISQKGLTWGSGLQVAGGAFGLTGNFAGAASKAISGAPRNGGRALGHAEAPSRGAKINVGPGKQLWYRLKNYRAIRALEKGDDVLRPRGKATFRELAEITAATGNEVGFFRLKNGQRVIRMGDERSVGVKGDVQRFIAHTHPNGILEFSDAYFHHISRQWKGDLPLFNNRGLFPRKPHSSILVSPTGERARLRVPSWP